MAPLLLLQERMCLLERLQLFDLPHRSGGRRRVSPSAEDPVARILPPLGQHEGMDLQRIGDRLHLHPGLPTQSDRRQLELVAVPSLIVA